MIIHKIETNRYYGGTLEIPNESIGIPLWTTRTAPPEIPNGFFAIWNGGGWDLTTTPPTDSLLDVVVNSLNFTE